MAMSGINSDHIYTCLYQRFNPFNIISSYANGSTYTQAAKFIFTGAWEVFEFLDILKGDQAAQDGRRYQQPAVFLFYDFVIFLRPGKEWCPVVQ